MLRSRTQEEAMIPPYPGGTMASRCSSGQDVRLACGTHAGPPGAGQILVDPVVAGELGPHVAVQGQVVPGVAEVVVESVSLELLLGPLLGAVVGDLRQLGVLAGDHLGVRDDHALGGRMDLAEVHVLVHPQDRDVARHAEDLVVQDGQERVHQGLPVPVLVTHSASRILSSSSMGPGCPMARYRCAWRYRWMKARSIRWNPQAMLSLRMTSSGGFRRSTSSFGTLECPPNFLKCSERMSPRSWRQNSWTAKPTCWRTLSNRFGVMRTHTSARLLSTVL